jgi:hypothetical protein
LGLPLLVTLQLQLHAKQLNLQPLGLLDLLVDTTLMFLSATLLLVGMMLQLLSTLLFMIALQQQLLHKRSQRCAVFWNLQQVGIYLHRSKR